eukprot:836078-Rhodomonas_salina.1
MIRTSASPALVRVHVCCRRRSECGVGVGQAAQGLPALRADRLPRGGPGLPPSPSLPGSLAPSLRFLAPLTSVLRVRGRGGGEMTD